MLSRSEHISFGFVPQGMENVNVPRRFPSHTCYGPVLGGLWVEAIRAIFESKLMLPWSFSEEAAASKVRDRPFSR